MAEIDKTFNGMEFEKGLAHFAPVKKAIKSETKEAGRRAKAIHAQHRSDGHSFVEVDFGKVDGYVILNDERGQLAAMAIEFGRGPADPNDPDYDKDPFPNGTEGTYTLHKATGLTPSRHFPHSKRRKRHRKPR